MRHRDITIPAAVLVSKGTEMKKMVLVLLLGFSSVLALSRVQASGSADGQDGARRTRAGTVTRLITKDLPDVAGKEGMIEVVDFAPGEASQVHRHNADLFVYVLEGSIITQLKGSSPQTVHAGGVFSESPTDIHIVSRNASETQPAKLLVFYVKAKGTPPTVILTEGDK
jgi:quercetin dioxygenase-like cupin family protein